MVRRIYVEKKKAFAVKASELQEEIIGYLGIKSIKNVRELIRYDVENVSDEVFEKACTTVFSEPPVDDIYYETFKYNDTDKVFSVQALPGQFDQRADSAEQCIRFIKGDEEPVVKTAITYVIEGNITDEELSKIENYVVNPVDSAIVDEAKKDTLIEQFEEPKDVETFDNFTTMSDEDFEKLYESLSLAMTLNDFKWIRTYFKDEEHRNPTVTEIRVLDTYWSDHCRHTTFSTQLENIEFMDGDYKKPIEDTYNKYLIARDEVYKTDEKKKEKFISLMDIALMGMKKLKQDGKLCDMEESEENNACTIVVPVEVDYGKEKFTQEWLVFFKNETHNHPTEIEPFGGAATCLGGAIRDPLSGRGYVYQAMRVTGAADPTVPVSETLKGKLSQKKLVTGAAAGYSSYGNQIGLATGYVKEIYHENYVAKRMEIGAVMGAAPRENVMRMSSCPGDKIILLGGRTGRDGIGGATGSSKAHDNKSLTTCGAEVQKGNAPTERKLQRLFRRKEVSSIIKKCNDFGAGGVSVAIGELADGLDVNLDMVPKKYAGLDGTEIAISESQERMAVVVDAKDVDKFLEYARSENLEATLVATVTKEPRLVLRWRDKKIVDLSRKFLDTNGAHQETDVKVEIPAKKDNYLNKIAVKEVEEALENGDIKKAFKAELSDLNVCSQKGLVERFDSSIGAASVEMPYGGKYQLTATQNMIAKLPVLDGETDTVTMMAYGFDPYLSSWSPYHGAAYAVTQSVARIVAGGGKLKDIHFTFQEYFKRMMTGKFNENEDAVRGWSQPLTALLGAFEAQLSFGKASIGGKDSMSGTFNDINVPPTLCSFAVDIAKISDVITPEFKDGGDDIVEFVIEKDEYDLPNYDKVIDLYEKIAKLNDEDVIKAAYSIDSYGLASAICNMSFGNKIGVKVDDDFDAKNLFKNGLGNIVIEIDSENLDKVMAIEGARHIGKTTKENVIAVNGVMMQGDELLDSFKGKLCKVFPDAAGHEKMDVAIDLSDAANVYVCKEKVAKPRVFIPVFPGSNCEYDSMAAFKRAGADVDIKIFKNQNANDIYESVEEFEKAIDKAQIIMFPGGFSAGDEPDGSAKFFATAFQNAKIKEAVEKLINERDGLVLGICNGFQAIIKLGLVPNGKITGQDINSPTLTFNTINRHISKMAYLKVVSNNSPWLTKAKLGGVYANPASHGEGRFVAPKDVCQKLIENRQVAFQYCDIDGNVTMDSEWNINGSYMAIEGIMSPDGRCLGKMCHSERIGKGVAINIYGEQDLKLFESGVEYFK